MDVEAFLAACPAVFRLEKKAPASKVLKLIKLLVKQQPSCRGRAVRALAAAPGHASPDVQEQALDLLEPLRDAITAGDRGALADWRDLVAANLRPRLEVLIGETAPAPSAAPSAPGKAAKGKPAGKAGGADPLAAAKARANALPAPICAAAGVDAMLQVVAAEHEPLPAAIDPRLVPRRDPALAVAPIASLEELIDTVAAFIERVEDAMQVERILDGICRFHSQRPVDFEKRVAPLRKRVEARSERYSGSVLDVTRELGIPQVIRQWLELPELPAERGSWWNSWARFLRDRTDQIGYRMQRRGDEAERELPLLALPTYRGGWLDPGRWSSACGAIKTPSVAIGDCFRSTHWTLLRRCCV